MLPYIHPSFKAVLVSGSVGSKFHYTSHDDVAKCLLKYRYVEISKIIGF